MPISLKFCLFHPDLKWIKWRLEFQCLTSAEGSNSNLFPLETAQAPQCKRAHNLSSGSDFVERVGNWDGTSAVWRCKGSRSLHRAETSPIAAPRRPSSDAAAGPSKRHGPLARSSSLRRGLMLLPPLPGRLARDRLASSAAYGGVRSDRRGRTYSWVLPHVGRLGAA